MNKKLALRSLLALIYTAACAAFAALPATVIITLLWQGTEHNVPSSSTNISGAQFWAIYRLCAFGIGYVLFGAISRRKRP